MRALAVLLIAGLCAAASCTLVIRIPSNEARVIPGWMGGAKKWMDIRVAKIDDDRFARAVARAGKRGVKVRLVVDRHSKALDRIHSYSNGLVAIRIASTRDQGKLISTGSRWSRVQYDDSQYWYGPTVWHPNNFKNRTEVIVDTKGLAAWIPVQGPTDEQMFEATFRRATRLPENRGLTLLGVTVGTATVQKAERTFGKGLESTGGHPRGARVWYVPHLNAALRIDGFDYDDNGNRIIDSIDLQVTSLAPRGIPSIRVDRGALAKGIEQLLRKNRREVEEFFRIRKRAVSTARDAFSFTSANVRGVLYFSAGKVWRISLSQSSN